MTDFGIDSRLVYGTDGQSVEDKLTSHTTSLGLKANQADLNTVNTQLAEKAKVEKIFSNINGIVDYTSSLQSAINAFGVNGGKIKITAGTFPIKGTIILRQNVIIEGITQYNIDTDNAGINHNTVIINHIPDTPNTDLFIGDTPQPIGYLSGISIKNLCLYGNANSRYSIKIDHASNLEINDLAIRNFIDGIVCDTWINSSIDNINIASITNAGIRFTGGVSTTVSINKAYIHNLTTPVIVEKGTVLGVDFIDAIFETCVNGLDIYTGNVLNFVNPYTENIPSTSTDTAIFNFGVNGTDDANWNRGICNIFGGTTLGINGTPSANSSIFKVERWASLNIIGTRLSRSGNIILTTANTGRVQIGGAFIDSITNTTLPSNVLDLGNTIGSSISTPSFPQKFSLVEKTNGTRFDFENIDDLATGYSALKAKYGNTTAYRLDWLGNVQIGGAALKTTSTANCLIIGESGNVGVQTIGFNNLVFASRVDGVTLPQVRLSNLTDGTIHINQNGNTASRPTAGRYIGKPYFDTALNKPIWWNGTVWVDSAGTTV